jgi:CRP-like cAMP-binding protein
MPPLLTFARSQDIREADMDGMAALANTPSPRTLAPARSQPPRDDSAGDVFSRLGRSASFSKDAQIYGEGEPADYFYKLISGAVRTYKSLTGGRRQIDAFYRPGDVFGLAHGSEHTLSADAVTDVRVRLVRQRTVEALAQHDCELALQFWTLTREELRRSQGHLDLLAKTADERVASFLLEMAARARSEDEVQLSMSRQDIADHLGLTIETVSRTFSRMESTATIALPSSRNIVLRDRARLNRLNGDAN